MSGGGTKERKHDLGEGSCGGRSSPKVKRWEAVDKVGRDARRRRGPLKVGWPARGPRELARREIRSRGYANPSVLPEHVSIFKTPHLVSPYQTQNSRPSRESCQKRANSNRQV